MSKCTNEGFYEINLRCESFSCVLVVGMMYQVTSMKMNYHAMNVMHPHAQREKDDVSLTVQIYFHDPLFLTFSAGRHI